MEKNRVSLHIKNFKTYKGLNVLIERILNNGKNFSTDLPIILLPSTIAKDYLINSFIKKGINGYDFLFYTIDDFTEKIFSYLTIINGINFVELSDIELFILINDIIDKFSQNLKYFNEPGIYPGTKQYIFELIKFLLQTHSDFFSQSILKDYDLDLKSIIEYFNKYLDFESEKKLFEKWNDIFFIIEKLLRIFKKGYLVKSLKYSIISYIIDFCNENAEKTVKINNNEKFRISNFLNNFKELWVYGFYDFEVSQFQLIKTLIKFYRVSEIEIIYDEKFFILKQNFERFLKYIRINNNLFECKIIFYYKNSGLKKLNPEEEDFSNLIKIFNLDKNNENEIEEILAKYFNINYPHELINDKKLSILEFDSIDTEIETIALNVKYLIEKGVSPDEIVIVFNDLKVVYKTVNSIFSLYNIPFHITKYQYLSEIPFIRFLWEIFENSIANSKPEISINFILKIAGSTYNKNPYIKSLKFLKYIINEYFEGTKDQWKELLYYKFDYIEKYIKNEDIGIVIEKDFIQFFSRKNRLNELKDKIEKGLEDVFKIINFFNEKLFDFYSIEKYFKELLNIFKISELDLNESDLKAFEKLRDVIYSSKYIYKKVFKWSDRSLKRDFVQELFKIILNTTSRYNKPDLSKVLITTPEEVKHFKFTYVFAASLNESIFPFKYYPVKLLTIKEETNLSFIINLKNFNKDQINIRDYEKDSLFINKFSHFLLNEKFKFFSLFVASKKFLYFSFFNFDSSLKPSVKSVFLKDLIEKLYNEKKINFKKEIISFKDILNSNYQYEVNETKDRILKNYGEFIKSFENHIFIYNTLNNLFNMDLIDVNNNSFIVELLNKAYPLIFEKDLSQSGQKKDLLNHNFIYSTTSLEQAGNCIYSYFFRNILNLKRDQFYKKEIEIKELGIILHKVLEKFVKTFFSIREINEINKNDYVQYDERLKFFKKRINFDNFLKVYENVINEFNLPETYKEIFLKMRYFYCEKLVKVFREIFKNVIDEYRKISFYFNNQEIKIKIKEIKPEFKIKYDKNVSSGNFNFISIIDLIIIFDVFKIQNNLLKELFQLISIYDYKSGKINFYLNKLDYPFVSIQLPLYLLALESNYKNNRVLLLSGSYAGIKDGNVENIFKKLNNKKQKIIEKFNNNSFLNKLNEPDIYDISLNDFKDQFYFIYSYLECKKKEIEILNNIIFSGIFIPVKLKLFFIYKDLFSKYISIDNPMKFINDIESIYEIYFCNEKNNSEEQFNFNKLDSGNILNKFSSKIKSDKIDCTYCEYYDLCYYEPKNIRKY